VSNKQEYTSKQKKRTTNRHSVRRVRRAS
jgi:hypothetical protein